MVAASRYRDRRGPTEISESELPKSLSARLRELGGRLRAHTSVSGSVLRLELST